MNNYQALKQGEGIISSPNLNFHPAPASYVAREAIETPSLRLVYGDDSSANDLSYLRHNMRLYSIKAPSDYGSNAYGDNNSGQEASRNPYGIKRETSVGYEAPEGSPTGENLKGGLADLLNGASLPSVGENLAA